jgi:hypothetical protein
MVNNDLDELVSLQQAFCRERGIECVPSSSESKLGFAIDTQGRLPINGLRHPPEAGTNGWYLWCGEELSSAPNFFSPLHTERLSVRCPEVRKLLGLPPGYRFLLAGEHLDIWFDGKLLQKPTVSPM